jgi:hypothetical protein
MVIMLKDQWDVWMQRARAERDDFKRGKLYARILKSVTETGQEYHAYRPAGGCRVCSGEDQRDFEAVVRALVQMSEEVDVITIKGKEEVGLMRPEFAVWLVQNGWTYGFRGATP